ncbi:hypothetical protein O2K51_04685 [Apibacter raozihei]|uniref:hypothetical protein n=1 Tax=Apibacter raozihei TaxID=2500547 RepID=UPI000FE33B4A|nr:hypothetical protein [Apibacter raozihei]
MDFNYKPATTKLGKLGATLNEIYVKSNIDAILYLMSRENGVFYQEQIELANNSQDNWKWEESRIPASGITTVLKKTLPDADASKYLLNGQIKPEIIYEIDKKQIARITIQAYQTIRADMTEQTVKNRLEFKYLKPGDTFTSVDFDNAYSELKNHINPINETKILSAIASWKTENTKITDINDKIKKKYKIAILENILNASYIIDEYVNSEEIANELKNLDSKNDVLFFYVKQKNNFTSNNQQIKEFSYSALPNHISIPESNNNLFTSSNSNSTNESYAKINKLKPYDTWDYNPILNLNNFKYQLTILKDESTLFLKYQNFLMDEILWYMINIKNNTKPLPSKSKKEMEPFIAFAENLNAEYKNKHIFKFSDSKKNTLLKAREYVSANYNLNDFFQFIPSINMAVNSYFETKNENLTRAFNNTVDINSIVQLRKLVYDNFYENQRIEKEKELDVYIEDKAKKIPTYKDRAYFEFKNSINVLAEINNKRLLSDEEYKNYQDLLNVLLYRLNTYK